ncbi:probable serine/threonine-protein kinase DDB_G0267514 [Eriocheir sinensis]|uniref:probable serine/threonine-protein kinase DDB_G0267514 n=1 Tax=Eriocheir sinensis TaxID=95602 RepID=UPI0021C85849|nr:probable serine/threonine-protein kinase DDB_G0267514 [Eriocheir sinensis]
MCSAVLPGAAALEGMEVDEVFLRRQVVFLSEEELSAVEVLETLAEGAYGSVDLIRYKGELVTKKLMLEEDKLDLFLREARVLVELDGAGGVPRLLALCLQPPTLIQEYAGKSYDDFLEEGCSVGLFLDSVVCIARQLSELHAKQVIHNDIKSNNVTVSGPTSSPTFRIIDCGLATRTGQPLDAEAYDLDFEEMDFGMCTWMSPELKDGQPLLPASDVYALGVLLRIVSRQTPHGSLKAALQPLVASCTQWDPEARPSLQQVVAAIHELKESQPEAVLHAALYDDHSEERPSLPQAAIATHDHLQESQPEAVPDAALRDDHSGARPSLTQPATAIHDLQESQPEAVPDAALRDDHSGARPSLTQPATAIHDLQESQPEAVPDAALRDDYSEERPTLPQAATATHDLQESQPEAQTKPEAALHAALHDDH